MKKLWSVALGALAISLIMACGNGDKSIKANDVVNNPNTADGVADMENLPAFEFETETHDFGRISQGEKVSFVFKFKNAGKRDLIISGQKATCGCTVADYPKEPIKPGESGAITVSFDSEGKRGMNTKTVTLTANTQPNTKVLTIKAEVVLPEK
jgi:hypothetical protein